MPYKDPEINREYRKKYYREHKDEIIRKNEIYIENNKEEVKKRLKKYRENNKEVIKERQKKWRTNNKEKIIEYRKNSKEYFKKYYENNKEKVNRLATIRRIKDKLEVLQHYSKFDIPKCECCKISNLEHLSLDHINGGGGKHRKEVGSGMYKWIIKNNFPEGFRVLCFNCNHSYGMFGYCPHKDKKKHEEYINLLK